jgi:hypothetical protein
MPFNNYYKPDEYQQNSDAYNSEKGSKSPGSVRNAAIQQRPGSGGNNPYSSILDHVRNYYNRPPQPQPPIQNPQPWIPGPGGQRGVYGPPSGRTGIPAPVPRAGSGAPSGGGYAGDPGQQRPIAPPSAPPEYMAGILAMLGGAPSGGGYSGPIGPPKDLGPSPYPGNPVQQDASGMQMIDKARGPRPANPTGPGVPVNSGFTAPDESKVPDIKGQNPLLYYALPEQFRPKEPPAPTPNPNLNVPVPTPTAPNPRTMGAYNPSGQQTPNTYTGPMTTLGDQGRTLPPSQYNTPGRQPGAPPVPGTQPPVPNAPPPPGGGGEDIVGGINRPDRDFESINRSGQLQSSNKTFPQPPPPDYGAPVAPPSGQRPGNGLPFMGDPGFSRFGNPPAPFPGGGDPVLTNARGRGYDWRSAEATPRPGNIQTSPNGLQSIDKRDRGATPEGPGVPTPDFGAWNQALGTNIGAKEWDAYQQWMAQNPNARNFATFDDGFQGVDFVDWLSGALGIQNSGTGRRGANTYEEFMRTVQGPPGGNPKPPDDITGGGSYANPRSRADNPYLPPVPNPNQQQNKAGSGNGAYGTPQTTNYLTDMQDRARELYSRQYGDAMTNARHQLALSGGNSVYGGGEGEILSDFGQGLESQFANQLSQAMFSQYGDERNRGLQWDLGNLSADTARYGADRGVDAASAGASGARAAADASLQAARLQYDLGLAENQTRRDLGFGGIDIDMAQLGLDGQNSYYNNLFRFVFGMQSPDSIFGQQPTPFPGVFVYQ